MNIPKFTSQPTIEVSCTIRLNEAEMRMLKSLATYSARQVHNIIKDVLEVGERGEEHYPALQSLIYSINSEIKPLLKRADAARAVFTKPEPGQPEA